MDPVTADPAEWMQDYARMAYDEDLIESANIELTIKENDE